MLSAFPQISYLNTTWKMLRARIIQIPVIFDKYGSEYQGLPIHSPTTINPKLFNLLLLHVSDSIWLVKMVMNIPYMTKAASKR